MNGHFEVMRAGARSRSLWESASALGVGGAASTALAGLAGPAHVTAGPVTAGGVLA